MDHLEHLGGSIDGHQDLSKGVLRTTMQSGDNAPLHFITSTGLSHSGREQEYIESTLLGTDLLSSQLPANLLNDYINSVSSTAPPNNIIGSMQSALLEHQYRPLTADELHTLISESSNDASGSKDIPGFSTLSSYDKMINMGQSSSPMSNGLAQIASTIDSYVHFPLHASGSGADGFDVTANTLVSGNAHQQHGEQQQQQQQHHHYSLPHPTSSHLHLQHQTQGHLHPHQSVVEMSNSQQLPSLGHPESAAAGMSTLHPVDVAIKVYSHSNSILPIASSSAPVSTDVHSSTTMSISSLGLNESPKRFYSCTTLPSLISHNQRTTFSMADNLAVPKETGTGMVDCEARTHDEEIVECVASLESSSGAMLGNMNLPHKKRLAKKLGDTKEGICNGASEMDQSMILAGMQLSQPAGEPEPNYRDPGALQRPSTVKSSSSKTVQKPISAPQQTVSSFACQLCGNVVQDQLAFFNHLKQHYEPSPSAGESGVSHANSDATNTKPVDELPPVESISPLEKGMTEGKKVKPKLPRVKHTKKLKNDRTVKHNLAEDDRQPQRSDGKAIVNGSKSRNVPSCPTAMESLLHNPAVNDAMIVLDCSDNGGEFSETEDMLEGIRNVVQKVQETVDTDTNEDLCLANDSSWFPNGNVRTMATAAKTSLTMPEETLDAHEIHMQNGGDNFLLLLSKTQFNDTELLPTGPTDTTLLKPLDSSTCGQLVHVTSMDASTTRDSETPGNQPMQPVQTLSSTTPFPLLSSVDALPESHAASLCSRDSLPIGSILELSNTNTASKISVASFASSHCGQIPDLNKARLLKNEHSSDIDDEDGEDASDAYEQMQLAAGIGPLEAEEDRPAAASRRDEQPLTNYHHFSDDDAADAAGEHFAAEVPDHEEEEVTCINDKELLDASAGSSKLHKYLCTVPDCGRWFKSKTAFTYHQLQHSGERPYQCQTCQKCFFTCSALKVHERLHSGEKPYKCEECGHLFRQWGDLKYHKISKHSNEKSHKCDFCGKEFARRYSLVLHRRIHTNEKNFICEYCNKAFRASSYLQSHRMVHTGEKPHQCNVCDKKFRCHGDLNRHQKTHSRVGKMEIPAPSVQEKSVDEDDSGLSVDLPGEEKLESASVRKEAKVKRKSNGQKNNNSIVIV
ncbi:uncharacterized protein LOC118510079 [Anopheles stephensi]|uniref:uncharacterized protein LOC118510079 n=1 Tax=Anopheles stephensi TaxID=30069 RepID=UPI001658B4E9|nr:uncharacterized protein LOC118510079 [Anopheles stephensi]